MIPTDDRWRALPCKEWPGGKSHGYGHKWDPARKRAVPVHRLAWELTYGPIPDGLQVCHRCDNPPCYEVTHLFLGTWAENMEDMRRKGRASGDRRVGEDRGSARLTWVQVRAIRAKNRSGTSYRLLAEEYGVARGTIGFICRGETWPEAIAS